MSGIVSTDTSSSLSGVSGTTYSPKSSSNVGTSSSSFGISSNSSIKSMELMAHNNSSHNNENNMANTNDDLKLQRSNSINADDENSQVHSLPIYSKSPVVNNQSEEILGACSQDLFNRNQEDQGIGVPITYATSTPFVTVGKKKQAHFSRLQLSGGSSVVDKSHNNISVSSDLGSSNPSKPTSPSEEVVEKKLQFDSPSLDVVKKHDFHFGSLELSGGSSVVDKSHDNMSVSEFGPSNKLKRPLSSSHHQFYFESPSNDGVKKNDFQFSSLHLSGETSATPELNNSNNSNFSKPEILRSPSSDHGVVAEDKLKINSLTNSDVIVSEKGSETLDIPLWCKGQEERHSESSSVTSEKFENESIPDNDKFGEVNNEPVNNKIFLSSSIPDIFNPVVSQLSEKSSATQACTQLSNVASSFDENLPQMNFELSQPDFQITESVHFTSLKEKNDLNAEEKNEEQKPTCSKNVESKDSENNRLSSTLSCTVDNKDLSTSLSDVSKCEMSEEKCVFKVDMPVFALWNKIYYPGIITKLEDSTSITVHFHDDQVVTMPRKNAFSHNLLSTHGQLCKVKLSDEYYLNAILMASYEYENEIYYAVLVNEEHTVVDRNSICFTQAQRQKIFFECVSNNTIIPRKRRRTEPVLSSGSENYFIAKTPSKKLKLNLKLFEGLTIYIIPEDTPVLCTSVATSSMDEDYQQEDFAFNIEELKRLIEENGGVCIQKLHGRDMKRANKLICIARSQSASLPFIYAVVVGIPVLHYDWIHRSIEAKRLKSYENGEYALPAGKDIFGDVVEQNFTHRDPYTPLNLLRFYVHTDGEIKNQNRLLDMILYKCGCERLFSSMFVTEKTKKLPFNINNIDFVLTMVGHVPNALVTATKKANKNIVTSTWFVQCLINNQRLDIMDCSVFRYPAPLPNDQDNNDNEFGNMGEPSRYATGSPEFE